MSFKSCLLFCAAGSCSDVSEYFRHFFFFLTKKILFAMLKGSVR